MLTIDMAVLLAIVVVVRLRRTTHSRSRFDEKLTVFIVLLLGILIAPTDLGQGLLHATGQVVQQMAQVKL